MSDNILKNNESNFYKDIRTILHEARGKTSDLSNLVFFPEKQSQQQV